MNEETRKYRNMAIRFSGVLWEQGLCPQCGNNKDRHFSSCKKTFEELTNPRAIEETFIRAFETD